MVISLPPAPLPHDNTATSWSPQPLLVTPKPLLVNSTTSPSYRHQHPLVLLAAATTSTSPASPRQFPTCHNKPIFITTLHLTSSLAFISHHYLISIFLTFILHLLPFPPPFSPHHSSHAFHPYLTLFSPSFISHLLPLPGISSLNWFIIYPSSHFFFPTIITLSHQLIIYQRVNPQQQSLCPSHTHPV